MLIQQLESYTCKDVSEFGKGWEQGSGRGPDSGGRSGRVCVVLLSHGISSLKGSDYVLLLLSPQHLCEVCSGRCLISRTGQMQAEAELKAGPRPGMTLPVLGKSQCLGVGIQGWLEPRQEDPTALLHGPWKQTLGDSHIGTPAFQAGPHWSGEAAGCTR